MVGRCLVAYITATSLTDVFYVARRLTDRMRAWEAVGACRDQLHILSVGRAELRAALDGPGTDFGLFSKACG
jgi:hypothetical protein